MRSLVLLLALGGCAGATPHPAADPGAPAAALDHRPLSELAPAPPEEPPLDWRTGLEALRASPGAVHQHRH